MMSSVLSTIFFFFNDTAPTEIYTLPLHDALPILAGDPHVCSPNSSRSRHIRRRAVARCSMRSVAPPPGGSFFSSHSASSSAARAASCARSEEHTSELQSRLHLVCRLLLEKKKKHHG